MKQTQNNNLYKALKEAKGAWRAYYTLAIACAPLSHGCGIGLSRRIYDLRKRGCNIEKKRTTINGRQLFSYRMKGAAK